MSRQHKVRTHIGWRWWMIVVGITGMASLGCNPSTLSLFLMPFVDDKIQPEYKLFAQDREFTLVILTNFAEPPLHPDVAPAKTELAETLAQFVRKRCQDNKHRIKIIPAAEVSSYQLRQLARGDANPLEIGKHFKADYVLDLDIRSLSLFEKNSYPPMFRGNTEIAVDLYKLNAKEGDSNKAHWKIVKIEYPGARGPIDAGSTTAATFRSLFLTKVARDISKVFIAFPPEERIPFE